MRNVLDSDAVKRRLLNIDGGPGSGNFGHKGRPGQEGGSGPGGASVPESGAGDYTNQPKGRGNGRPSRWEAHKSDLYNDQIRNAKNETAGRKAFLSALKSMPDNTVVSMSLNGKKAEVRKDGNGGYTVKTFGIFDRPKTMTAAQIVAGSSMKPFERPEFTGDSMALVEDGGPGSGNWGHKGRPGLRGGSGKGGGKHYRSARNEVLGNESKSGKNAGNKTGYIGSRRDWANGLSGDRGHRADKFVDKWAPNGGTKEHTATQVAEARVMSHGSKQDKLEYLDLKSEARLFDERKDRYLNNLTDEEKKAFEYLEAFGATDAERLSNMVEPEVQEYYLDLKSKALEGPVFGVSMPDSVVKGAGLGKKEAELPSWAGSVTKDKWIAKLSELQDKYNDDAADSGMTVDEYILRNGTPEDVHDLLSCADDALGYSADRVKKRDLQEANRSLFEKKLANRFDAMGLDPEQKKLMSDFVWASGLGMQEGLKDRVLAEMGDKIKDNFSADLEDRLLFAAEFGLDSVASEALEDSVVALDTLDVDGHKWVMNEDGFFISSETGEALEAKDLAREIISNGIRDHVLVRKAGPKSGARNIGPVNDAAVRATLINFEDYSAKSNEKKAREYLSPVQIDSATENMAAIFDKFPFRSRTKIEYLTNIVNDHYKNQFEVGHSEGCYDPHFRARVAGELFGCDSEKDAIAASERECYGYLGSPDEIECCSGGASAKGYGGVSIAWKKEALAGSVTYTIGDSFGVYDETPAGSVNIGNTTLGGFDSNSYFLRDAAMIKKADIDGTDNWNDLKLSLGVGSYLELQYHGDRLTADKIESIAFDSLYEYNKLSAVTKRKLKALGVKLCVNKGGTAVYV